jgi:fumarate hydratase class II
LAILGQRVYASPVSRPCASLTIVAIEAMANDLVVGIGGASGYFGINVCKPLVIFNTVQSATMVTDG